MDLTKERQQRKEFCDILFELSKSQELLQDATYRFNMYKRLEALYYKEPNAKRFRHFYTDIFSVLTQVQQNPELGDINILGQNLDIIRNGYNPPNKSADGQCPNDVSDAINKLYDHVNLDIARIAYSDAADRRISGESSLETLQTQINLLYTEVQEVQAINKDFEATEKKLSDVEGKLENHKKNIFLFSEYLLLLYWLSLEELPFQPPY